MLPFKKDHFSYVQHKDSLVSKSGVILKELYVRLWPKLVLQSLSNYCRPVYPLPLPLTRGCQMATTDFVIGRYVEGGASEQNTT